MAKETPKLSEMKAPRRKAAINYTPRRNPEAEKVMGQAAAAERAQAERAVNSRFSGESVTQSRNRIPEEDLVVPSPRSSTPAPTKTARLVPAGMYPTPVQQEVRPTNVWEEHVARAKDALRNVTQGTPEGVDRSADIEKELHRRAVEIHRQTTMHGLTVEDPTYAGPTTTINGVRLHGTGKDDQGFAVDPRTMGAMRADGTRVGERAKTLDEIKKGLKPAAKSSDAPALGPIEKARRRIELSKMTEQKSPDVTPENMAPTLVERIQSGDLDAEKFDRDMNLGRNTPRKITSISGTID